MPLQELSAPATSEAASAPWDKRFVTPTLLPICCMCGLVRDETAPLSDNGRWVTQQTYRQTHVVNPIDLPLTHTYCPECMAKAQDTVRTFLPEIGALP